MTARKWMGGQCLVFEAVNHDRLEVVVAIGREGFESAFAQEPDLLPPEWSPTEHVEFRVVERDLALAEAAAFALRYTESEALKPYRVYLGGMAPMTEPGAGHAAPDGRVS